MTDAAMAACLSRTYGHRLRAFRPRRDGSEAELYRDIPCALSRSAHTSAPQPLQRDDVLPETEYRLSLYTLPEHLFRLGDRVEAADGTGRVWHGRTSESVRYPSHCVTVVAVNRVEPAPPEPEQAGASREACPEVTV